jgi:hypothetical protein
MCNKTNERQQKIAATKAEYNRVYNHMILPARDIEIDGWIKRAWHGLNSFGWGKWERN